MDADKNWEQHFLRLSVPKNKFRVDHVSYFESLSSIRGR